jgi:hypothetical protein
MACKIPFTIACTHTCNLKKHKKEGKKVFSARRFSLDDFVYIQGISCYKEKALSYEPFYSLRCEEWERVRVSVLYSR